MENVYYMLDPESLSSAHDLALSLGLEVEIDGRGWHDFPMVGLRVFGKHSTKLVWEARIEGIV